MSRARLLTDCLAPGRSYRYGSEHRCQRAELHLPAGAGPHPVVVTIHGGSWSAGYGKIVMRGLAARPRAPRLRGLEHRVPADRARPGRRLAG